MILTIKNKRVVLSPWSGRKRRGRYFAPYVKASPFVLSFAVSCGIYEIEVVFPPLTAVDTKVRRGRCIRISIASLLRERISLYVDIFHLGA